MLSLTDYTLFRAKIFNGRIVIFPKKLPRFFYSTFNLKKKKKMLRITRVHFLKMNKSL